MYIDILNTKPETRHVLRILSAVCHKWEVIGVHLGVEESLLGSERKSNEEDDTKLYHVIRKWAEMDGEVTPVTWGTIFEVVEEIGNKELIDKLSIFLKSLQGISHTVYVIVLSVL